MCHWEKGYTASLLSSRGINRCPGFHWAFFDIQMVKGLSLLLFEVHFRHPVGFLWYLHGFKGQGCLITVSHIFLPEWDENLDSIFGFLWHHHGDGRERCFVIAWWRWKSRLSTLPFLAVVGPQFFQWCLTVEQSLYKIFLSFYTVAFLILWLEREKQRFHWTLYVMPIAIYGFLASPSPTVGY